jgi:phosphomannomutase
MDFSSFKAYDIRGIYPSTFNETMAGSIGRALASLTKAKCIVIGGDIRNSTESIKAAIIDSLNSYGINTIDIGLCGSELVYFASSYLNVDAGIMITASHNPKEYNGLKLVRKNAVPIGIDSGLLEIKEIIAHENLPDAKVHGSNSYVNINQAYVERLLSFIKPNSLAPLKIVTNAGNGCAGFFLDLIEKELPLSFIKINHEPDGDFPNDVPNPMLIAQRQLVSEAVINNKADLGIAWDGDFDRCFFYDEEGNFIDGYYIVGLLSEYFLRQTDKTEAIVYDPRVTWNTEEIIKKYKGKPVISKSGHSFIKNTMKTNDAIFGGEMSGHYYFRDFFYADTGMVPWLIISQILTQTKKNLSELVSARINKFPSSGEINIKVADINKTLLGIEKNYISAIDLCQILYIDGITMEFTTWRFNLRASNTEPLIRLNIETKNDKKLLMVKIKEITQLITSLGS